jgi:nucleoside-diphosphate-sugar epimerase
MKVFIAGATGVVGSRMVPLLVRNGHEVIGTTRTPSKTQRLAQLGATPVVLDALDDVAVKDAVAAAQPDVIVHELTAIPDSVDPRKLDEQFAATNRLRTEGMDHLLEAARAADVRRFVAQSFAAWAYARTGGPVKTETDPIETHPPASVRQTLGAILHVERSLAEVTDI